MSPSVARKSPMGRRSSKRSVSSDEDRGSPPRRRERSPAVKSRSSRSPLRRDQSPPRHKSSRKDKGGSPVRERHSSRGKSPKRDKSSSPVSRSPSPRTKRLRRVQAESEVGRAPEREHDRNLGKGSDKSSKHERTHREKDVEKLSEERRERRSERERDRGTRRDRDRETVTEREKGSGRERDRETVTERNRGTGRERDRDSVTERDRGTGRERDHETVTERDREAVKSRDRDAADRPSSRSRHRRSESPSEVHHHHSRHRSRSPRLASRSRARDEDDDSRRAEHRGDVAADSVAMMEAAEEALETKEKQKPSFELSGTLAAETNRVRGITLLFDEPPDARKPDIRWRLYVFKGGEVLNEPLYVHRQSCYLFGRERRIADIPTDHPSCSKQHAVLQYRQVEEEQPDGIMAKVVRPYLMDLGSTNKTFINDSPLEPRRYYELREKDTIKFGNSSREYVLLHENSHH